MFGLYGLALYVAIALIGLAVSVLLALFAVMVGLITHPLRTLALILGKVAAIAAGLALMLALLAWFAYDHTKPDFLPVFAGSIAVIVGGVIIYGLCEWFLERPTRAERRATQEVYASAPTSTHIQVPAQPSTLHRDVVNGLIDPTPWPIRWWCEDGGRLWTAYVAQHEGEDPCGIYYSPGDIVVREHRDEQTGVRLCGGSYVRHEQGRDPR